MKQITILCLVSLIFFSGCGSSIFNKIPKGNKGNASQQEKESKQTTGSIEGEIDLPSHNDLVNNAKTNPDWVIRADGAEIKVPYGSKGKIKFETNTSEKFDSFTKILSSWKVNSAPVQLFIFGGIIVAVGVGLIIFGMGRLGAVAIGSGIALIACGVVINSYPWVFLIVVLLGLVIGGYFLYNQYKKKKIQGESEDQFYTLERLVDLIARLPNDLQEEYFKQPLREDDASGIIRKITRQARGIHR
jgi:hypothetical protein